MRALADQVSDLQTKSVMLRIADDYERGDFGAHLAVAFEASQLRQPTGRRLAKGEQSTGGTFVNVIAYQTDYVCQRTGSGARGDRPRQKLRDARELGQQFQHPLRGALTAHLRPMSAVPPITSEFR
jgi:hypothetical protein